MGGPTRGSVKKAGLRSGVRLSQTAAGPSSGTTVFDETMNVVCDSHYATPQGTQSTSGRSDMSPLTATLGTEVDRLGEGVKDLISTMNELEKLGLGKLDIPLAKCIVCGDQSAGKSSVIEAVSGIKVPRAGGTCTRCPMFVKMECSTEPNSGWEAKIFLRKVYQFIPHSRKDWDKHFPQWQRKLSFEEVLFAQTSDKEAVGNIIHGAQLAILNPEDDPARYVPGPAEDILNTSRQDTSRQAEFSPNVVCVYISAPGLPNLSFYDLPGVIIARGNRSKEVLKRFIDNLVTEYIRDPYALVLLTSSLEIDWDIASNAAGLVSKTKATGRCVGVLTKPDRIDNKARWADIQKALDGDEDRLGHGYFVVKQPSQEEIERDISHREAREAEEHFFNHQQPWAGEFSAYRGRFGTLNLQTALSKKLAALSLQTVPRIWEATNKQLETIEAELNTIPKPPTQGVAGIVHGVLKDFAGSVRKEMRGKVSANNWRLKWDALRKQFEEQLQSLAPRLHVPGALDRNVFRHGGTETIDLCSDDEDGPAPAFLPASLPATPQKRKLDQVSLSGTPSRNLPGQPTVNSTPQSNKKAKIEPSDEAIRYNLDQVRTRLYEMSSAKLAHQVNPKAIEILMRESLQQWAKVMTSFFENLEQELSTRIRQILDVSLAKWRTTGLFQESGKVLGKLLKEHFVVLQTVTAADILANELSGPFIFHRRYFEMHVSQYMETYTAARLRYRTITYFKMAEENLGKSMSKNERDSQLKKGSLTSDLANDPYAQEVQVIAQVRAYYELASIRFFESICLPLEAQLFKQLSENLFDHLIDGLQLADEDVHQRCVQLLADNPDREARRQELEGQKARLLAGQKCLRDLNDKYKDSASLHMADGDTRENGTDPAHADGDDEMQDDV